MSTPAFDADLLTDVDDIANVVSPLVVASRVIPDFRARAHQKIVSDAVLDAVLGRGPKKLAISVPPQHGKSSMTSISTPLWWLEMYSLGLIPGGGVGIVSYEDSLAISWSQKIRRTIEENPDSYYTKLRKDSKAGGFWETEQGGFVMAVGISGSIVGRPISLLVLDDVTKNSEQAASEKHRDTVWNFWQSVGLGRLQPWSVIIVTSTRWSDDDLTGRLLSKEFPGDPDAWRYIRIPAIADSDDDPLGRKEGEPLLRPQADQTPEQALENLLEVKGQLSPYLWQTIWQQSPTDPLGAIFFESKWRYWGGKDIPKDERHELPANFDQVVMSWDMAFRDTKGSDWVVGTAWGRVEQDYYLLEMMRGHWGFTETCSRVNDFAKSIRRVYPKATAVVIEGKANGDAVMNQMRSKVGGLVDFEPGDYGSKLSRAWAVQPFLLGGNMYIPAASERSWVREYTRELANFPTGAHDDCVDSTTMAILWMQKFKYEESGIAVPSGNISNLGPIPRADSPLPFRQYMR